MKIAICTKRDIFGAMILSQMLPRLKSHELIVLLADRTRNSEVSDATLGEIKFFERDLPESFGLFEQLEKKFKVPTHTVTKLTAGPGEELLRAFAPDLILSARFSLIFKADLIQLPRYGVYNVHPGALPGYGGLFAPFRGLLNGESHLGCTLHKIVDAGIDTGPVCGLAKIEVRPERSLFWHISSLYPMGLELFLSQLTKIEAGHHVDSRPQDPQVSRYYRMPEPSDFVDFKAKGFKLFESSDYLNLVQSITSQLI